MIKPIILLGLLALIPQAHAGSPEIWEDFCTTETYLYEDIDAGYLDLLCLPEIEEETWTC